VREDVYRITGVAWKGYDPGDGHTNFTVDGNPAKYGGGDSLSAERNYPLGYVVNGKPADQIHEYVKLEVTINEQVQGPKRAVRFIGLLDPDHYSSDLDFDTNDTGGRRQAGDNIKNILDQADALGGHFVGWNMVQDKPIPREVWGVSTQVEFAASDLSPVQCLGLDVSHRQPGNNFVAIAVKHGSLLPHAGFADDGVTAVVTSPAGQKVAVPADHRTQMLTVWRTVCAELDSMGVPDYEQPDQPSYIESGDVTGIGEFNKAQLILAPTAGVRTQFEGGTIVLCDAQWLSLGVYDVAGSVGWGNDCSVFLAKEVSADIRPLVKHFKYLSDDDINGRLAPPVQASDMVLDASLWAQKLEPALVVVDLTRLQNYNEHDVPFQLNVDRSNWDSYVAGPYQPYQHARSGVDYWVVTQVGAFQGDYVSDRDPDAEAGQLGVNRMHSDTGLHVTCSFVFRETIRDQTMRPGYTGTSADDLWRIVSVHEAMHSLWIPDPDARKGESPNYWGSLMNQEFCDQLRGPNACAQPVLSGKALRRIAECTITR
jgi:hypothetical protein